MNNSSEKSFFSSIMESINKKDNDKFSKRFYRESTDVSKNNKRNDKSIILRKVL